MPNINFNTLGNSNTKHKKLSDSNYEERIYEYEIKEITTQDVLDNLNLKEDDEMIYKSIIMKMDKFMAESIKNKKIVSMPYIGTARINPVRVVVMDNLFNFKLSKKVMSKEEYREHVKAIVNDAKSDIAKQDREKLNMMIIKRTNKEKYEKLFRLFGKCYAELFLYSIRWMTYIPFDQEFEDAYKQLND